MQKTLIYIDVRTKAQIRVTGSDAKTSDYPIIERGQWQILCIQFVDRITDTSGSTVIVPAKFDSGSSFLLVGDNNFLDDDSLMFKSYQSTIPFEPENPETNRFNIEGDWIGGELIDGDWVEGTNYTADLSKGQMSIRVNAATDKFAEALGNKERITSNLYINIKQYIAGISNPSTIAWFKFIAANTVRDGGEVTEQVPEGTSIVPFVDSALRNPIEMQFSADGVSWHKEQAVGADSYYRFRIYNVSTAWSSPVQVINGNPIKMEFSVDGVEWFPGELITPEYLGDDYDIILQYITFVRYSTENGWTPALRFKGDAPQRGIDYWTQEDIQAIITYIDTAIDTKFNEKLVDGEW